MNQPKVRFVLAVGLLILLSSGAAAQIDPAKVDLTGTWICEDPEDEASYHVRQVGKTVWWSGISKKDNGDYFSNVFRGTLEADTKEAGRMLVKGEWADVRGKFTNSGALTLEVILPKEGQPVEFRKIDGTGGFGGRNFKRDKK